MSVWHLPQVSARLSGWVWEAGLLDGKKATIHLENQYSFSEDFPDVNLLEQIKTFRWYYDDDLSRLGNHRAALRRWMVRCWDRLR